MRHDGQRFARGDPASLEQLPQAHAVHKLHHQVKQAVGLAEIVDGDNAGMAQLGQRFRFDGETLGEAGVLFALRGEDLDRHQPVQRFLPRLIDHAHPAAPETFQEIEPRKEPGDFFRFGRRRLGCALQAGVFAAHFGLRGQIHRHEATRAEASRGVGRQRRAALRA